MYYWHGNTAILIIEFKTLITLNAHFIRVLSKLEFEWKDVFFF